MKTLSALLTILLLALVFSGESLFAKVYDGAFETKNGKMIYKVQELTQNEAKFQQVASEIPLVTTIDEKAEYSVSNDVPGMNKKGHSKLVIQRIDDQRILIRVDQLTYENDKKNQPNPLNYEVTAEFTKGSWVDLAANQNVEIKLTPESQTNAMFIVSDWMAKKIKYAADDQAPLPFIKFEVDLKNFIFDASIISGSLDQLVQKINTVAIFQLSMI